MCPAHFIATLLLICACYIQAGAQGRVTSEQGQGIEYATVVWQSLPDSTILKADVADSNGQFAVVDVPYPVLFTVMAPGYATYTAVINNSKQYTIKLTTDARMLEGVTVSTNKRMIERQADRTIFNVESSVASIGTDAYEVLKKAPGVVAGSNGNVSIAGKSTVSVMMNDKLVQLSGEELEGLLRSIPSGNLSKIEVITAPPARYDAQGNTGIINIVTKKGMGDGFNGSASFTYQQRVRASQLYSGNFNYRRGKLNVYGNGNINSFQFTSQQQTNTFYGIQQQEQALLQKNDPVFSMFQLGADYSITDRSVIGLQLLRGYGNRDMLQDYDISVIRTADHKTDSTLRTIAYTSELSWRQTVNLNYELKMDTTGKKLNIDADYFYRNSDRGRNFETVNRFADGNATGVRQDDRTEGLQVTDIRSLKADLVLPYKWAKLSMGAKVSAIHNISDNIFLHRVGGAYTKDTTLSNEFDYKENTQAAYISAQRAIGKWSMQLGLRYEQTQTEGVSVTVNQTTTNEYARLFPTAYITYAPDDDHVLNANYSKRIDRPGFWQMNPFRTYMTPSSYESGNPFLQPSFSNNIELGYTYKSRYTVTMFREQVSELYTRVSYIDSTNNSFRFTTANGGSAINYGISLSANITPVKWWESNTQIFGYYNQFNSTFYKTGTYNFQRPAFFIRTDNTFTLNRAKTIFAELSYVYAGARVSDFDIQLASSNLGTGFKALFFQKKLVVAVNAYDLLKTDRWRMNNQYNGTKQDHYYDERQLSLALTWKFGNSNVKAKRERSTGADESRRTN